MSEQVKSIKDYAALKGVAYETIRRQILKYEKELEGHIVTQGKTRYLDEHAMQFLDGVQQVKVVTVFEENGDNVRISELEGKISILQEELSNKKDMIINLQNIIMEKDSAYIELQKELRLLMEKQQQCAPDPVQKDDNEVQAVADPVGQERPEDVQSTTEAKEDIPPEEEPQAVEEPIEEPEGVPDEIKAVLDSFLAGEISAKEAWELSGLDKKTFSEMYIQYKRELHEEESIERPEEPTREHDAVMGESVKEEETATHSDHVRADIASNRESVTDLEENIVPEEVNKGKMSVDEEEPKHDPTKELHKMKLQQFAEEPKRTGLLRRIFSFWKN